MSEKYFIRRLEYNDYYKGYMDLMNIFTRFPESHSFEDFCNILDIVNKQNSYIYIIELDSRIVSSIKIIVEQKIHNNFKCVLHIEDLVTHPEYRKRGLAKALIEYSVSLAKGYNCYKIILCSNPENSDFYIKNEFIKKGIEFTKYI